MPIFGVTSQCTNLPFLVIHNFPATLKTAAPAQSSNYVDPVPGTEPGSMMKVTPLCNVNNNIRPLAPPVGNMQPSTHQPTGRRSPTYDYALANVLTNPLTRTTDPDALPVNTPSDRLPVEPSKSNWSPLFP